MSVLNLHEDVRTTAQAWAVVAWIPVYDEKKSTRPQGGINGDTARIVRLYHDCWRLLLGDWNQRAATPRVLYWAGGLRRLTRYFIGGIICDQQEADRVAGLQNLRNLKYFTLTCVICVFHVFQLF